MTAFVYGSPGSLRLPPRKHRSDLGLRDRCNAPEIDSSRRRAIRDDWRGRVRRARRRRPPPRCRGSHATSASASASTGAARPRWLPTRAGHLRYRACASRRRPKLMVDDARRRARGRGRAAARRRAPGTNRSAAQPRARRPHGRGGRVQPRPEHARVLVDSGPTPATRWSRRRPRWRANERDGRVTPADPVLTGIADAEAVGATRGKIGLPVDANGWR